MKPKPLLILFVLVYLLLNSGVIFAAPAAQDTPEAFFPEKQYEFDVVPDGTEITHVFKIQNKGTAPLDILKVRTGWGCTAVSYTKQIPAGGEGTITIKGDTTGYGGRKFKKTIVVETNDPKHPQLTIVILGQVENFAIITPRHVKLTAKAGDKKKVSVVVLPEEKYPFKIISAAADKGQFIRFDIKDVKKANRDAYVITIENTKTTEGRFFDTIKLKIDSNVRQNLDIWVFGNIQW